ncbi:putative oxidoreductase C-terminal domain-containing protein [Ferruginibacter paludis]|uniref:putative oxidoreductase C-terminal domain-containing protein n=1 Tax=Ferruginibacter paludis TaxID=1310417 RepID=UPI0025B5A757|nr:putative oxidoreductase C-terminal domain-containing protein [Ferruginibacter paludis]MDN3656815.1 putative oxidoreductase C-terminal domain-containing protein [Ferruginibacter paludis]
MKKSISFIAASTFFCNTMTAQTNKKVQLITLNPGHFHAALVQKSMYATINPEVFVYAPKGKELDAHLGLVNGYNTRAENPTSWKETVYTGDDYLAKMLSEKKGNVVVLAGNNKLKTTYISEAVKAGFNVLADKPMAINKAGFNLLEQTFTEAKKKGVLLYDIMTERSQATNVLQRELSMLPAVFGTLQKGTAAEPAVIKESVHHFFKTVSGKPLIRPAWYFDVAQEGEGIVDVTTHLVDLVQWECFPGVTLNYKKDIQVNKAKRWATVITPAQFQQSTQLDQFPDYLQQYVKDGALNVYANGSFDYTIKAVHARMSVTWNFEAPVGGGDTHYSVMKGTKASLVIRQGADQQYKPVLYIEPVNNSAAYEKSLTTAIAQLAKKYAGLTVKKISNGWELVIPAQLELNHEACFAEVTKRYLDYLQKGKMPGWEVPNMLAKYYTTIEALRVATTTK